MRSCDTCSTTSAALAARRAAASSAPAGSASGCRRAGRAQPVARQLARRPRRPRPRAAPGGPVPGLQAALEVGVDATRRPRSRGPARPSRRGGCRARAAAAARRSRPARARARLVGEARWRPAPRSSARGARARRQAAGARRHRRAPPPRTARNSSPRTGSCTTPDEAAVVVLERDAHRPGGEAVEVVDGAVERVDDPTPPATRLGARALLAEQAVVGPLAASSSRRTRSASRSASETGSVPDDFVSSPSGSRP